MRNQEGLKKEFKSQVGFSLIELLVVLVILGLLAGLVGPRLFGKVDSSKVKAAEAQVRMLKSALQTYRLDVGQYPTTEQGLSALNSSPNDARARKLWQGPYMDESVPLDPWGNAYQFKLQPSGLQEFILYSFGADGMKGGEGINSDIGYLPE